MEHNQGVPAARELAERCEKRGVELVKNAFDGYDSMRFGKEALKAFIEDAAHAFACAAALRARAASQIKTSQSQDGEGE